MKLTKGEITMLSKYLWKAGYSSKTKLAISIGCCPSEISRILSGGTMSEDKLNKVKKVISHD